MIAVYRGGDKEVRACAAHPPGCFFSLSGLKKFCPGVTNLRYLMQVDSIFLVEQVECVKPLHSPSGLWGPQIISS